MIASIVDVAAWIFVVGVALVVIGICTSVLFTIFWKGDG